MSKPVKLSFQNGFAQLCKNFPGLLDSIEKIRTEEQREWEQACKATILRDCGVADVSAEYAAKHSRNLDTAKEKAQSIDKMLVEMGMLEPFAKRVW